MSEQRGDITGVSETDPATPIVVFGHASDVPGGDCPRGDTRWRTRRDITDLSGDVDRKTIALHGQVSNVPSPLPSPAILPRQRRNCTAAGGPSSGVRSISSYSKPVEASTPQVNLKPRSFRAALVKVNLAATRHASPDRAEPGIADLLGA